MLKDGLQTGVGQFSICGEGLPNRDNAVDSPMAIQASLEGRLPDDPKIQADNLLALLEMSARASQQILLKPNFEPLPLLGGDPDKICQSLLGQLAIAASSKERPVPIRPSVGIFWLYELLESSLAFGRAGFGESLSQVIDILHDGDNVADNKVKSYVLSDFFNSIALVGGLYIRGNSLSTNDYEAYSIRKSLDPELSALYYSPRKLAKGKRPPRKGFRVNVSNTIRRRISALGYIGNLGSRS